MARLTKQATRRRDLFETAHVMLGSAVFYLEAMQMRVAHARRRPGLEELMEPAERAGERVEKAIGGARRALNDLAEATRPE